MRASRLPESVCLVSAIASPPPAFRPLLAFALLMAAQLLFTLLDATGKGLSEDMGIPLIALARHGGQVVLMLLVLGPRLGRSLFRTRHPWLQLGRGLTLAGFTLFFFSALFRLPQAEATAINFIAPFVVMLLAGRVLGETVTRARWVGATAGFLGMLAIVRPGTALDPLGIVFALLTVVCNVAFQLLTRRLATADSVFTTMFLSALLGIGVSFCVLPWQGAWGGWPQDLDAMQVALLLSMGVTGGVSQWCLIRAYYWSTASFVAPLVFLQMLWATASGWCFFGQLPDAISLLGMLVIALSGAATMLVEAHGRERRRGLHQHEAGEP